MMSTFKRLQLLTLPSLYILQTTLYCMSKCALITGRDIHSYGTRGRDNYRTGRHRTLTTEAPIFSDVSSYNTCLVKHTREQFTEAALYVIQRQVGRSKSDITVPQHDSRTATGNFRLMTRFDDRASQVFFHRRDDSS
ncbi:hypothetical protein J6590_059052 [Homalodisca vitripennis]|nr:hypothetical protein J6590_059052 [Homalodisca vitripennis]